MTQNQPLAHAGVVTSLEPPSPASLWAVHLLGPDDVRAAPSMEAAALAAARVNGVFAGTGPNFPKPNAIATLWTGTPEAHAADVARWPLLFGVHEPTGALITGGIDLAAPTGEVHPEGEVVAWIRFLSDGGWEGPIHDREMGDIRRRSDAWTPLGIIRGGQPTAYAGGAARDEAAGRAAAQGGDLPSRLPFDLDAMLRDCIPGGASCDPQRIADSIRLWFDVQVINEPQPEGEETLASYCRSALSAFERMAETAAVVEGVNVAEMVEAGRRLASAQWGYELSPDSWPDNRAVDRFARAMKRKLCEARAKGRGGWDGPTCNAQILSDMLRAHVGKGDPLDVANFCMFLHQRGESILPVNLEYALPPSPASVSLAQNRRKLLTPFESLNAALARAEQHRAEAVACRQYLEAAVESLAPPDLAAPVIALAHGATNKPEFNRVLRDLLKNADWQPRIEEAAELARLRTTNALLVRWKGEIDSWRISAGLEFPSDYDDSPRYAIQTLIDTLIDHHKATAISGTIGAAIELVSDDLYAVTFQSIGQYREGLLKTLRRNRDQISSGAAVKTEPSALVHPNLKSGSVEFPIRIPMGCSCKDVEIGSYANQVELPTPQHMLDLGQVGCLSFRPTTCVDRCLAPAVQALWALGVVTTGCCCGHNVRNGYIGIWSPKC